MLSIIIVNYFCEELILESIRTLELFHTDTNFEIIIINNGGATDKLGAIENRTIEIIEPGSNLGFSKANNLGLEHANGEYILYLNPDTLFISETLNSCVRFLRENKKVGALGCRLLNADKTSQESTHDGDLYFKKLWRRNPIVIKFSSKSKKKQPPPSPNLRWLTGAFFMMRKETIQEHNLIWDTDFFMYWEDVELSYRIRKKNLTVCCLNDVELIHIGGSGENVPLKRFKMLEASKLKFIEKTKGRLIRNIYVFLMKFELKFEFFLEKRKGNDFEAMNDNLQNELNFYAISKNT